MSCQRVEKKAKSRFQNAFFFRYSETSAESLSLDVHFQRNTLVIYRTDLLYGWMDLLVGFGGIFGLFLGASIISAVEFLFYVFTGIFLTFSRNK